MSYSFGVALGTKEAVKQVLMDKQYELQRVFPQSHLDVYTEAVERMPEGHNVSVSVSGHEEADGSKGWQSITMSHSAPAVQASSLPKTPDAVSGVVEVAPTPQVV